MQKTYRIGDLATHLAVTVETIRYYERETLLPKPARTDGNYRLYSEADRERLAFILNCRALDMTLQEIRHLLRLRDAPQMACSGVNAALDEHLQHVTARISVLHDLQAQLKALRARCEMPTTAEHCGILQGLAEKPKRGHKSVASARVHLVIPGTTS